MNYLVSVQTLGRWQLHKKPKTYIFGALWLAGLGLMFLAPAPVRITEEALQRYESVLTEASAYSKKHQPSLDVRLSGSSLYTTSTGWTEVTPLPITYIILETFVPQFVAL